MKKFFSIISIFILLNLSQAGSGRIPLKRLQAAKTSVPDHSIATAQNRQKTIPALARSLSPGMDWDCETIESGSFAALVLDASGNPRIAFSDYLNEFALNYAAYHNGTWEVALVATGTLKNTALALDSQGNPGIAYFDSNKNYLKYVKYNGNWDNIETIPQSSVNSATRICLDFDENDVPHIAFYDPIQHSVIYANKTGGSWSSIYTATGADAAGLNFSFRLQSGTKAYLSYYDTQNKDLKLAVYNGSSWLSSTISSSDDVGEFSSLALDSQQNPAVVFLDSTNHCLKYGLGHFEDSWSWSIEVASTTGGQFPSLALAPGDIPCFICYTTSPDNLKFFRKSCDTWETQVLESQPRTYYGGDGILKIDGLGNRHIVYSDSADSFNCSVKYTVFTEKIKNTIPLKAGWNLISLGVTPDSDSIETIFNSISGLKYVMGFFRTPADDGAEGFRTFMNIENLRDYSTLLTMDTWHGYWVYLISDSTLEVTGVPPEKYSQRTVAAGWNLSGYWLSAGNSLPKLMTDKNTVIDSIFNSNPDQLAGSVKYIMGFYRTTGDGGSEGFRTFMNSTSIGFSTLGKLDPGHGYWIYMENNGILNYSYRLP
ncbi:MAG: hypothetical protein PHW04_01335 [Candidatus Wallbacteria bacterium]|nr:hypothetical protein [Candidatus Wallbacteria bacterium]